MGHIFDRRWCTSGSHIQIELPKPLAIVHYSAEFLACHACCTFVTSLHLGNTEYSRPSYIVLAIRVKGSTNHALKATDMAGKIQKGRILIIATNADRVGTGSEAAPTGCWLVRRSCMSQVCRGSARCDKAGPSWRQYKCRLAAEIAWLMQSTLVLQEELATPYYVFKAGR